ncbi:MAG: class I SAM-dependent RNA methyltransferase [Gammaproteobacteria bacterium]|nr:class I SAM-dependent RNA methyltransferase [Gammaproteobacteria bacterium]
MSRWEPGGNRQGKGRSGGRRSGTGRPEAKGPPRVSDLTLDIQSLANDGSGIGRADDGRIVFVPGTAPGDRILARVVEARRKLLRAEIIEVLEPGPDRTQPECPAFGRCGGCSWQHIAYPAQVAAKAAILDNALRRIGGLDLPGPVVMTPSPQAYEYRGRARILVHRHRTGYRRAASDDHIAVDQCPILARPLQQALKQLATTEPADGEWELALGEADATHPEGVRVRHLGSPDQRGEPLTLRAGDQRIQVAAGGFAQANPLLFDALISAVADAVGRGNRLLELYAGAGFFTLTLASRFQHILAVESDAAAIANLNHAAAAAGMANIETRVADVERFLMPEKPGHTKAPVAPQFAPEVVFMDPPRAGLGAQVTARLCASGPERLVYLSCDPATFARDLGQLQEGGWTLQSVAGFDLFPQTPHIEALAVMLR